MGSVTDHRFLAPVIVSVVSLAFLAPALAQSPNLEHTYKLDNPDYRPTASLADVDWLVGDWVGEAFGNTFEEVWNPPSAGSMVGMFKLLDGEDVKFYELLLLVEEEGSLSLLVKHFNGDFTAWEDKEDYVRFRLVKVEDDAVHFSGISFYCISDDEIHGYLVLHSGGKRREEKLIYRRRD